MTTTPQDENKSNQISSEAALPEAQSTAADFWHKYLNEAPDNHVGPFQYPNGTDQEALPWDFPTGKFLDTLNTDGKNTLADLLQLLRVLNDMGMPQHQQRASDMAFRPEPNARPQFEAELEAMKDLSEVVAQAREELDEKFMQWMEVQNDVKWNILALETLMERIDRLADGTANGGVLFKEYE